MGENNTLNLTGDPEWMKKVMAEEVAMKELSDTMIDGCGNEVKLKTKEKGLSRAEKRRKEASKKARKAQGLPSDSEDDDYD
eukprot:NODE_2307_length_536_cov_952.657084_g1775_i0.p1 GENE.NODE_2307_length_536_cov_952.657084_g1775_i0~~NODE_2307_length_536_cov_952.657084_g1775_i0.p1  ORF type:complete len:92 (-),score=44.11 NODE_2307_length_536_cov_952.657084_g1775_i0:261-503(-)